MDTFSNVQRFQWKLDCHYEVSTLFIGVYFDSYSHRIYSAAIISNHNPATIYLFKVNNTNIRKRCEKGLKLTTKTISSVSNQPNILKQRKINQVKVKNKLTSMETFIDCGRFNEITSTKHTYQMRVYDSNWQHDVLTIKESRNVFNQLSKYQCVLENSDYIFWKKINNLCEGPQFECCYTLEALNLSKIYFIARIFPGLLPLT